MIKWSKFTGNRTPIGLDIGSSGLRAAQLRRHDAGYEIKMALRSDVRFQSTDDPPSALTELQRELRVLVRDSGFQGRDVVTSADPTDMKFHALDIPPAALKDESSTEDLVRFEVSRLMNESPEQLETGYWCVPPTGMPAPNAIGLGVSRSIVEKRVALCDGAGLKCASVDADAIALYRFGRLMARFADAIWGIVDVGERHVRLILCASETPALVRNVGSGSADWTRKIAESLQISGASAEVHKRNYGITAPARTPESQSTKPQDASGCKRNDGGADEIPAMLTSALRHVLTELAGEIKRSYEYLLNCYPGRAAGDLILVGGGSLMPNLPDYLTRTLGINVRRASAYLGTAGCRLQDPSHIATSIENYALTVGLAV
ncbi:MAG: pilus assembly protein PilM [Planctomycetes bacterium]|nr:pilus assembly protein PilM [Planctomycetota bacterium]MBI3832768.1 pilus assembly protein PilM [Planctomycetota bacterium]